jgi:hypothetical protein
MITNSGPEMGSKNDREMGSYPLPIVVQLSHFWTVPNIDLI